VLWARFASNATKLAVALATTWMRWSQRTEEMLELDTLAALLAENARLMAMLESHGIESRPLPLPQARPAPLAEAEPQPPRSSLTTAEKVYRCLPGPLGGQNLRQVRLRAGLRQRVASRCL
jgi:hypothetical protein